MKDEFVTSCLQILKREDVKDSLKDLVRPIIDLVLQEIYPYIYLSILFVCISFLLILGIFILLLRNKIIEDSL
tara:strand:- start:654 stop:872 length:219 start_codon:yes stop_codon:yes gene_type:complete